MVDLSEFTASGTMVIAADPETLYDMVSDVTRMGEWSPACQSCAWDAESLDGGDRPAVGSWFTGKNKLGDFEYETRCEVTVADRGKEFTWVVGGAEEGAAQWRYTFAAVDGGTEVEESSALLRLSGFFTDMPEDRLREIVARNQAGIRTTLENLKAAAEEG
ncbi:MAG: SRPBCC family protein [Acidimicrobiia bacterium]